MARRPTTPTALSQKRYKKLDLKSFFPSTNSPSGSNLGPSTRESGNIAVAESKEQEELGDSEPHPLETIQGVDLQEQSSHEQDVEGITVFNLDVHVQTSSVPFVY